MKTIYKPLFICLLMMFSLASCEDENEIPSTGPLDQAELKSLGTYSGEWEIINTVTGKVDVKPGSVIIGEAVYQNEEEDYTEHNVNTVTIEGASDLELKADSSVFNISLNSSGDLSYWNMTATNPFGTTFSGRITPTGELTLDYSVIIISGRGSKNQIEYLYQFKGNKQ